MNYCLCMNYRINVQGQMSHQHSLCGIIAHIYHIRSSSLNKSLALDRYSIVRSPYTGSDEPCTHTAASLGKLNIFSPLDRSGDVASFGLGQIQLLPISSSLVPTKMTASYSVIMASLQNLPFHPIIKNKLNIT